MQFNRSKFNRHLNNIGQDVLWRQAYSCTCVNDSSGAPDPRHVVCGGKGKIWAEGKKTRIGISHQDSDDKLAAMGHWEAGDMLASIPENSIMWDFMGQYDRVTSLNASDQFSLPLKRGDVSERFIYAIKKVTRVFWFDGTGALVEGGIPEIASNGTLSWPNGGEPPPGMKYSITGEKYVEYYVYGAIPSDRNEHAGMRLPKRCTLRNFDLFNR